MSRHELPRKQVIALIEQGSISAEDVNGALAVAKIRPDNKGWRGFIDRLLLWAGGLALASAILFFVAYNWNDIDRF